MSAEDVKTVIVKRREPFEISFLVLLVLTSIAQLLLGAQPGSISALMPGWAAFDWALLTLMGSATALLGVWIPNVVTGLFMERLGITVTASVLTIYAAAAGVFGGLRAMTAVALCLVVAFSFALRRFELSRTIKKLQRD